ncbi:uncharacterized protein LOC142574406 [Dermacentor variabilis]|uniref:uncharacterized protein LOC142574406 n=1 Tax=Dermacentor variabilis TaxID=34621 RepID=UPI003F5AE5D5
MTMEPATHVKLMWRALAVVCCCSHLMVTVCSLEPMKGYEPEKFLGKWWIVQATASVFHQGEQCAHITVNRKAEQLYNMTAEFRILNGRTRRLSLDLADDENPAQYTASLNDKPVIWATILGTDYENWAVVNIREGTYVSTVVASRKPTLDPDFHRTVQSIAEKNKIMEDFHGVHTEECRDSI